MTTMRMRRLLLRCYLIITKRGNFLMRVCAYRILTDNIGLNVFVMPSSATQNETELTPSKQYRLLQTYCGMKTVTALG